jgi:hypothetical protein
MGVMAKTTQGAVPLRIFFINDSFTAHNDWPGMIARLAWSMGELAEHGLIFARASLCDSHRSARKSLAGSAPGFTMAG